MYYYSYTSVHNIYQLNCSGSEGNILDCPYSMTTDGLCSMNSDANVFCKSKFHQQLMSLLIIVLKVTYLLFFFPLFLADALTPSDCDDGAVRLVGGVTQYEGLIEVCVNKVWGSVCGYPGTGWGDEEASIVCKQLGALPMGKYY